LLIIGIILVFIVFIAAFFKKWNVPLIVIALGIGIIFGSDVTGLIYFDNQFKNEKTFIKDFVLNHELGHYRYLNEGQKSELNADAYAYNKMIEIGYNPSQIAVANFYVLSNKKSSLERKKEIYKQTKNSY